MAVTVSAVVNPKSVNSPVVNTKSVNSRSFDITATADGDTTADIVHGIHGIVDPNKELRISFEPLNAKATVSAWFVTSRDQNTDGTTVRVSKGTGTGSGDVGAQVRVHIQRLHSLID